MYAVRQQECVQCHNAREVIEGESKKWKQTREMMCAQSTQISFFLNPICFFSLSSSNAGNRRSIDSVNLRVKTLRLWLELLARGLSSSSWAVESQSAESASQVISLFLLWRNGHRTPQHLIRPYITHFPQLENPIGFVITFCTCTAQSGGFSEAIGSHCGKRRKSPTEAERKPTVWREGNKFTTTAPPVMILNKAATNCQCLDSKASVSSKGGMQLSRSSWWKIRGSVPSQNWDTKSHWKARIKCTHSQQSGFTTWCLYTKQWWCKENNL